LITFLTNSPFYPFPSHCHWLVSIHSAINPFNIASSFHRLQTLQQQHQQEEEDGRRKHEFAKGSEARHHGTRQHDKRSDGPKRCRSPERRRRNLERRSQRPPLRRPDPPPHPPLRRRREPPAPPPHPHQLRRLPGAPRRRRTQVFPHRRRQNACHRRPRPLLRCLRAPTPPGPILHV